MAPLDPLTQMRKACIQGDLALVQDLLTSGADINQADEHLMTPLHLACYHGNADIVRVLLANGADIKAANKHGQTGLHMAARHGHIDVVKALCDVTTQLDDTTKTSKMTALHLAAKEGHEVICDILLKGGSQRHLVDQVGKPAQFYASTSETQKVFTIKNPVPIQIEDPILSSADPERNTTSNETSDPVKTSEQGQKSERGDENNEDKQEKSSEDSQTTFGYSSEFIEEDISKRENGGAGNGKETELEDVLIKGDKQEESGDGEKQNDDGVNGNGPVLGGGIIKSGNEEKLGVSESQIDNRDNGKEKPDGDDPEGGKGDFVEIGDEKERAVGIQNDDDSKIGNADHEDGEEADASKNETANDGSGKEEGDELKKKKKTKGPHKSVFYKMILAQKAVKDNKPRWK